MLCLIHLWIPATSGMVPGTRQTLNVCGIGLRCKHLQSSKVVLVLKNQPANVGGAGDVGGSGPWNIKI